jgi:hypothetical protein
MDLRDFSNDPKVLVNAVTTIETAGQLNSYLRRFALRDWRHYTVKLLPMEDV